MRGGVEELAAGRPNPPSRLTRRKPNSRPAQMAPKRMAANP
jgi:hypothetical protein